MVPDDAVLRDKLLQAVQRIRSRVGVYLLSCTTAILLFVVFYIQETREHIEQYAGPTGEGGLGFNVPPVTT